MLSPEKIDAIVRLSKKAECYFLDYKLVSKQHIDKLGNATKPEEKTELQCFVISTCLRYEIYHFSDNLWGSKYKKEFAYASGKLCIKRLLSILCGLQSEIVPELEIFIQTGSTIYSAVISKKIDKKLFWDLYELLELAKDTRDKYGLNLKENYSTIGARLLSSKIDRPSTLAIIGGGYMVESFWGKINLEKINRIIWVDRNIDKIKKLSKFLRLIPKVNISFKTFDEALPALKNADFIFAAIRYRGGLFKDIILPKTKCIIDVSYPSIFSTNCCDNFYTISNTYFEHLLDNPVPKNNILKAELLIDGLIERIKL